MTVIPAVMMARMNATLTTVSALLVIAWTCGRVVTSGVVNAVLASSDHSTLIASRVTPTRKLSIWVANQATMSGTQDVLEDGQDHRGEQRQRVADAGGLQAALGAFDLGGV